MKYLFTLFTACLLSLNLSAQIQSGTLMHAKRITHYEYNAYTNEYDVIGDKQASCYFYFDEDSYDLTVEGVRETGDWEYAGSDEYGTDIYYKNDMGMAAINYRDQIIELYDLYNYDLDLYKMFFVLSEIEQVK